MELIELNAKPRVTTGKGAARQLRAKQAIPAIVYGEKKEPTMLALDTIEFDKIIRNHGSMGLFFNLKISGADAQKIVMLKDMHMDTFGQSYLHVDLQEIDMDKKITVSVQVEVIGKSIGVKEGGLLQIIRRELDVVCKPMDTPDTIQVDITDLEIGDAVHVNDIDLGENIHIPHDVNFTVITIVPPSTDAKERGEEDDEPDEKAPAAPAPKKAAEA
ncbi:MAG: 50S ribosomal protein L25/general stress protein Ctc [Desulfobacterales bacterium RIFOXYA12_FULL_46_15]|nr:MAG: 50S ribosomal protein L25/general stress protein Ctc [Desulfobacterales bacterium RIFOXYA12_FULL_46_15]